MTALDRIKKIAKKRGLSLTKVNDLANLGTNTIYSWKTKEPSYNNLNAVADVLGVNTDYLLGKTDNEEPVTEPKHIDVEDIVDNSAMLTSRDHALSDEDKAAIRAMLTTYLNSREGQNRLREYGGYGNDGNKKDGE